MSIKLNKQTFIEKANKRHNNKYNYSLVEYVNYTTKVKIICTKHGEFEQNPKNHLNKQGCYKCGREKTINGSKKITNETFIEKANKKHNHQYDYSKINYVNPQTKIIISCKIHKEFEQMPYSHLNGSGCPICGLKKVWNYTRISKDKFVEQAKIVHANTYDYSKVDYINSKTNIDILCNIHGIFSQSPTSHLQGRGCLKCGIEKLTGNVDNFKTKAIKKHGNKYDYSKTVYIHSKKHILIICPIHGSFFQQPSSHLRGYGCKNCHESIGEKAIRLFLEENKINFIPQKKFKNCKHINELPFDFYLPNKNLCIEYDGEQHFKPIKYWGGQKSFDLTKKRDKIKNEYCKKNNIILIRFSYKDSILQMEEKLLELFLQY